MKPKEKKILILLIISLILIDQIAKLLIFKTNITLINEAGWGIGVLANQKSENNIAYILISIIAVMMLVRYINSNNTFIKTDSRIILSFAVSGAISNVIDRVWNGGTINYINIPKFTPINLSYVYFIITWIGMAIILTKYTNDRIKEKKNTK